MVLLITQVIERMEVGKTVFGGPKSFKIQPGNRDAVKLILDCDNHTLESQITRKKQRFNSLSTCYVEL